MNATIHHYYAVIGRVPEDSEDGTYFFDSPTPLDTEEILSLLEEALWEDSCLDGTDLSEAKQCAVNAYGTAVWIHHCMHSTQPIDAL